GRPRRAGAVPARASPAEPGPPRLASELLPHRHAARDGLSRADRGGGAGPDGRLASDLARLDTPLGATGHDHADEWPARPPHARSLRRRGAVALSLARPLGPCRERSDDGARRAPDRGGRLMPGL